MAYTITNIRRGKTTPQFARSNSITPNVFGVTYADVLDDGKPAYAGTLEHCKGWIEFQGFC